MVIINRKEEKTVSSYKGWIFVFGRRKTGKSFLVRNFVKWDEYFFVKRDKTLLSEDGETILYETLLALLKRELEQDKTIVVDEFHRLGDDFLDFLHASKKSGKLILISSTLFLSKKLLSKKSPILGLFSEIPIRIISLEDTLNFLRNKGLSKKEMMESAILLREPIAINLFDKNEKVRDISSKIMLGSLNAIQSLIGEIFLEEEKNLSATYEGILRSIARGNSTSSEIANYIFSRRLIAKNDPSIVQQYLKNLISFGILKRVEIFNKKRFIYKHVSPLINLFYYADEKYNILEREITPQEIKRIIEKIMPRIVEDNLREFMAERFGLKESKIETKDYDVDICLLNFKKPDIVMEVKWKKNLKKEDITKTIKNLSQVNAKEKYLFVSDKKNVKSGLKDIKVVDILDFVK